MEELIVLCKLVRMSVFGTEEDIPTCVNWPKVFAEAGVNGVSAICYEAVKRLPADRQPDFDLMLRWDLSAQGIREGFHRPLSLLRSNPDTLLYRRPIDLLLDFKGIFYLILYLLLLNYFFDCISWWNCNICFT